MARECFGIGSVNPIGPAAVMFDNPIGHIAHFIAPGASRCSLLLSFRRWQERKACRSVAILRSPAHHVLPFRMATDHRLRKRTERDDDHLVPPGVLDRLSHQSFSNLAAPQGVRNFRMVDDDPAFRRRGCRSSRPGHHRRRAGIGPSKDHLPARPFPSAGAGVSLASMASMGTHLSGLAMRTFQKFAVPPAKVGRCLVGSRRGTPSRHRRDQPRTGRHHRAARIRTGPRARTRHRVAPTRRGSRQVPDRRRRRRRGNRCRCRLARSPPRRLRGHRLPCATSSGRAGIPAG